MREEESKDTSLGRTEREVTRGKKEDRQYEVENRRGIVRRTGVEETGEGRVEMLM